MLFFLFCLLALPSVRARGPPNLLPQASNFVTLNVNENAPLELLCPVALSSDLSIQWLKNKDELDPLWSTSNLSIRRATLRIHHVHGTDAGLYQCNVVNGFGHVHAQFRVHVQSNGTMTQQTHVMADQMDLLGEAPELISQAETSPTRVIQPEGTAVQFKCLATGKPTPEIRWKKNGKILSEDEYGLTQSQILNIKDLRQSDTGNYTCELFNAFGTLNATYVLLVTEKLQFFGNDPQNTTIELERSVTLNCRVQTDDPSTKIQWLKKLDVQQVFRPDAIVFDSEQYELLLQRTDKDPTQHAENILSKPLVLSRTTPKESGQYVCLVQNAKLANYRKAFLNVIDADKGGPAMGNGSNLLFYAIVIPLVMLCLLFCLIYCLRRRGHHQGEIRRSEILKSSLRPRQPLIHYNGAMIPSTSSGTSQDYLTTSVDSIPVTRHYSQSRYGPSATSDLGSLASSNLYYARVQAL